MNIENLAQSVSYCGLVCGLCSHRTICSGCTSPTVDTDKCDKDHCPHRACCLERGLAGCWACDEFPCEKGRFMDENRGQTVGFGACIRAQGLDGFIQILLDNEARGVHYGLDGAYYHQSEETVRNLLNG